MPYRVPTALDLSEAERTELESWSRRKTAQALASRVRIVLRSAAGLNNTSIAAELGRAKHTVGKWRERFAQQRTDGLLDEPRPGAPRRIDDEQITALVDRTLAERRESSTHWSQRRMAKASGLSATTVGRAWRAFGLQPHRAATFKLSTDPLFARAGGRGYSSEGRGTVWSRAGSQRDPARRPAGGGMNAPATHVTVRVPLAIRRRPGRKTVVTPVPRDTAGTVPMRADPALIKALARAFWYQRLLDEGRYASISEMAAAEHIERGFLGTLLRLTLLAPDIVEKILGGQRYQMLTLPRLMDLFPSEWSGQRVAIAASAVLPVTSEEVCGRETRIARHRHTHTCR